MNSLPVKSRLMVSRECASAGSKEIRARNKRPCDFSHGSCSEMHTAIYYP